jgi:CO/xanthine dehydrogenase FAD-binding subunit
VITTYHRPQTVQDALELIRRPSPRTVPLGGGTLLAQGTSEEVEVVDLQNLKMDRIEKRGNTLTVGATTTLQHLMEHAGCPAPLVTAIRLEAPLNLRNAASVAGSIVVCDGRSPFATVLLALDARLSLMRQTRETIGLGEFLLLRKPDAGGYLITGLELFLGAQLAFEYAARTPADKPIVAAAIARWNSGRTRVVLGGYGPAPILAMDGPEETGIESAVGNALRDADDPWGSAAYRMDVAATLCRRCLAAMPT